MGIGIGNRERLRFEISQDTKPSHKDKTMTRYFHQRLGKGFLAGLSVGLLIGIGMLIGATVTSLVTQIQYPLPEFPVEATASTRCDTFAAATAPIDDRIEGLFTLDFITGQLQCAVMYVTGPRARSFGAVYQYNVMADLGVENTTKPNFLLVTGFSNLMRGRGDGPSPPASCVVYVIDANTGNFAAYGVPWNPGIVSRGTAQGGSLQRLATGTARMAAIRE